MSDQPSPSLENLLRLRTVVARYGEMDVAGWWNTKGQLGPYGAIALRRGLPRTHYFAQARSVFAVAAQRCSEVFEPPASVTLWRLPASIEEAFDARWEQWLDHAGEWNEFFARAEGLKAETPLDRTLHDFGLVKHEDLEAQRNLKRSADGRAFQLPGTFTGTDADITGLALGFSRGEKQTPTVPYMRLA